MLYLLYRIGLFIIRVTSLETSYKISDFVTGLKYRFSRRDRETVRVNLRVVMPGAADLVISKTAHDVFKNFGRYLISFFTVDEKDAQNLISKKMKLVGTENIKKALDQKKGCIVLSGHIGNWELSGYAAALSGFKISAVALAHTDKRINRLFINQRNKAGIEVIPIGDAKNTCFRTLGRNEVVAILGDRAFGDRGVAVNFFGKKAIFPRGAALFSIKTGAPIVMTFSYKENEDSDLYTTRFEEPISHKSSASLHENLKEIMQIYADRFAEYIKKYPSQWYMFYNVWER